MPYASGFELPNVKTKGALGTFFESLAFGQAQRVWPNHCALVNATTETENHAFAGALPRPQRLLGDRRFQGMIDFTYSLADHEHELTFLIRRKSIDDDQTGTVRRRLQEIADACNIYEDALFGTLLTDGNVSGSNAYDGVVFHGDTRVIGSSANIDNNTTSAAATGTIPTALEMLAALNDVIGAMMRFQDDQGRVGMVRGSLAQIRLVVPPTYERPAAEAFRSNLLSSSDNPWGFGRANYDVLPDLSGDAEMFVNAVGGNTRPFIMQQRSEWEIMIFDDPQSVADNHGVKVLCYKRFRFGYGEPRMSVLHTFS
jgi:phage major head subunit gpT-like protein